MALYRWRMQSYFNWIHFKRFLSFHFHFPLLLFTKSFIFLLSFRLLSISHAKISCWNWQWYFSWTRTLSFWVPWKSRYSMKNNFLSGTSGYRKTNGARLMNPILNGLGWEFQWWLKLTKLILGSYYFFNHHHFSFLLTFFSERRLKYGVRIFFG